MKRKSDAQRLLDAVSPIIDITPTPWETTQSLTYYNLHPQGKPREVFANVSKKVDAEKIVRAVNSFEPLMHACRVALDAMTSNKADGMPVGQILEDAIAKGEGK